MRKRIRVNGGEIVTDRGVLNVISQNATAVDNPVTKETDLTLSGGGAIGLMIAIAQGNLLP